MATAPVQIEPVPPAAQRQALEFLLGGACGDIVVASRAEALQQFLHAHGQEPPAELWWALDSRQCVAAAMVTHKPGNVGLLLHSPAEAPGVDRSALAAVVRRVALEALGHGAKLVQTLVEDGNDADLAMVKAAGFSLLARLVHMRLTLAGAATSESPHLRWRCAEQFGEEELGQVIAATYEGSLDCPALAGVRSLSDVITCHKGSGLFRPQSWWIVDVDGEACGCVLVNDSPTSSSAEIVYLGVVPRFRGRGIGRQLLRHAAADARARRLESLELAVDDRNFYAQRVYESEHYRVTRRQWAYVMFADFHLDGGS